MYDHKHDVVHENPAMFQFKWFKSIISSILYSNNIHKSQPNEPINRLANWYKIMNIQTSQ